MSQRHKLFEDDRRYVALTWHLIKTFPAASWPLTVGVVVVLLIEAATPPLLMVTVGRIVGAVAPALHAGAHSAAANHLLWLVVQLGILFVAVEGSRPFVFPVADQLGMYVRGMFFKRSMAAQLAPNSIAHLEDAQLKDIFGAINDNSRVGPRMAVRGLVMRWSARLGALGSIILVGLYRWWAGLVLLAVVVLAARRTRIAHVRIVGITRSQTGVLRRSDYYRDLMLTQGAEKEVRVFGLVPWLLSEMQAEWHEAMSSVWQQRRESIVNAFFGIVPVVVVIAWIGLQSASDFRSHRISLSELVIVLQALVAIAAAASAIQGDTDTEMGVGMVEDMLKVESETSKAELRLPGSRSATGLPKVSVRFEGVHFSYPAQQRAVFTGLDLEVVAGKSLAIVGENGVGKSTLVKLLCRLYDPTSGVITVDGLPLAEVDATEWQRRCAAIFQDFQRYPWTVEENIAFRVGADRSALSHAAQAAGALELIQALPDSWQTVLSRQYGGVDLSGGQWQRIALTRAIYAAQQGAGILILDEPTAQLDVRQEAAFYDRFLDVTTGVTSIVISHRFSTVRRADRIVVLEHGQVVEAGSHEELIDLSGVYASMFRLQAQRYADGERSDA